MSNTSRTTEIIRRLLSDKSLSDNKIKSLLPESIIWEHFNLPVKHFPKWVYKSKDGMSHFGLFVDLLLRIQLHINFQTIVFSTPVEQEEILFALAKSGENWKSLISDIIKLTGNNLEHDYPDLPWNLFGKFEKDIKTIFSDIANVQQNKLYFNMELIKDNIEGHPDIVCFTDGGNYGIIDIKTVRNPKTNCLSHIMQICTYASILRSEGKNVDYIGLYYPLQENPLVLFNLDPKWDHDSFLAILKMKADFVSANLYCPEISDSEYFRAIFLSGYLPPGMGSHVEGCSKTLDVISKLNNFTFQVFLTPRTGKFPIYDIDKIRSIMTKNNLIGFSHTPYFINLCKPETSMFPDPLKSLETITRELHIANQLNFRGCVIHVGKNIKPLNLTYDEAFDRMKYYVLWCICHANISCPLLLETCCGAGTEMLANQEDFCSFYEEIIKDYPAYYKRVWDIEPKTECPFGICIDTAHIHGAGIKSQDFIDCVEKRIGIETIKLIHYNDSKQIFGSCKDGHMVPGMGQIPIDDLLGVYNFAMTHSIPMVRE